MPVIIPDDSAYMEYILPDILKIVDGDTGVGDESVAQPGFKSLTYYSPNKKGFAQTQFFNILHATPNFNIYLKYTASNFQLPEDPDPKTGHILAIAEVQGATYAPGSGNANPSGSGVIQVFLDAYNDNGANYWVRGQDGTHIFSPRWVQLFHELSHALHIAKGHVTDSTPDAQEDALTITDENQLRAQYNPQHLWLKQRALTEEGGPGMPDPEPAFNNPTPKSNCFIISAATASSISPEVSRFRSIRDILLCDSVLGNEFFADLYAEYYRYSPRIAADMNNCPLLRKFIRDLFVIPLLNFFKLFEQYASTLHKDEQNIDWDSIFKLLLKKTFEYDVISQIHVQINHLRNLTPSQDKNYNRDYILRTIQTQSIEIEMIFEYLIVTLRQYSGDLKYTRWAIIDPLLIYWNFCYKLFCRKDSSDLLRTEIATALNKWISSVPFPSSFSKLDQYVLTDSLAKLAKTVFTLPEIRYKIGDRILDTFSGGAQQDLKTTLSVTGYYQYNSLELK
jgi:hypothetical protein